ncbi:hypothetical protein [Oligella urethralis]|uniref:hypothetical protein n=1 Tax=Oligella urethralis TaxID=90245 RepID=UPI00037F9359|nr:hypothetical protein [Oligella urethralis]SUA64226.1 Uncharacterised protein [Oligella urethralis]
MNSLLTYPNILWVALVLVAFLIIIHLVTMKMLANHFRKKYPEAFDNDGKLKKAQEQVAAVGPAAAVKLASAEGEKAVAESATEQK